MGQTESGVSAQPMSDAETLQGATQRAHAVLAAHPDAAFGPSEPHPQVAPARVVGLTPGSSVPRRGH
jgi:hypothetical protein